MAKNINNPNQEKNEKVGEAVSQTEEFFKKNGRKLSYTGVVLILVAAIIVLVIQFYSKPMKAEAVSQTFTAEQYFRAEDYDKALNGDGNALGFAQIIDEYGAKAGKAVYLYAGICELQLGNAQEAIETALSYYLQAAETEDNIFAASYLLKAGIICEELGRNDEALAHYRVIKDKYPQSYEGYEIDKYISRIEVKK